MKNMIAPNRVVKMLSVFLVLICLLPLAACKSVEDPLASVELSNAPVSSEKTSESDGDNAETGFVFSSYRKSAGERWNIVAVKDHYYRFTQFEFAGQKIKNLAKFNVHTGEAVPVCADPLCKHEYIYGSSCPFGEIKTLLAVEDDRYVYFTRSVSTRLGETTYESTGMMYFMRYDPVTLTSERIFEAPSMTALGMTESYVYFVKRTWIDKEVDKPTGEMSVYRYDLQKNEFETLCVYDRYTYPKKLGSGGGMSQPLLCEYEQWLNPLYVDGEDRVYFEKYSQVLDDQGGVEERTQLGIYILDSKKSNTIEALPLPSFSKKYSPVCVKNNRVYFTGGTGRTVGGKTGYNAGYLDLTTMEYTLLSDICCSYGTCFTEEYFYYWEMSPKLAFKRKGEDIYCNSDKLVRVSLETGERKEYIFDMTEKTPGVRACKLCYIDGVAVLIDGRCEYADERIRVPSTMYFNLENETWFAVDLPDMSTGFIT